MAQKLIWSQKSFCDLRDIFDYVKKDSSKYAEITVQAILEKVKILKGSPYIGRIVPEFNKKDLRELLYKNYRIIYKLKNDQVIILRIHHSARNPESI